MATLLKSSVWFFASSLVGCAGWTATPDTVRVASSQRTHVESAKADTIPVGLQQLAKKIREVIEGKDIEGLLSLFNKGVLCADTTVPVSQLRKDLANPQSFVYSNLFDTPEIRRKTESAEVQSAREFFIIAKNIETRFEFRTDQKNSADIYFHAKDLNAPFIFLGYKRGERWYLGGGRWVCDSVD